jgi:hypothetical protein
VLYFWVGLDMADFDAAYGTAFKKSLLIAAVTSAALFGAAMGLFWASNPRLPRNREHGAASRSGGTT